MGYDNGHGTETATGATILINAITPDLLSVRQAAALAGVHPQTIGTAARRGELRSYARHGNRKTARRQRYFKRADVKAWLAADTEQSTLQPVQTPAPVPAKMEGLFTQQRYIVDTLNTLTAQIAQLRQDVAALRQAFE